VAGLTGIPEPVTIAHAGDSRLFVVLKGGKIRVFDGVTTRTFLDISGLVNTDGERGFLGLAFHPDYKQRLFFVYYSNTGGMGSSRGTPCPAARTSPMPPRPRSS
jgi:hypothetical protein